MIQTMRYDPCVKHHHFPIEDSRLRVKSMKQSRRGAVELDKIGLSRSKGNRSDF